MKLEFFRHIFFLFYIFSTDFRKILFVIFHENPSGLSIVIFHENSSRLSLVVSGGRTDRQANMSKLIVAVRSFANAPSEQNARRLGTIYLYPSKTFHVNVEVAAWIEQLV